MSIFNPSVGAMAGIAWADKLNERDFQAEQARLNQDITAMRIACFGRRAMADASRAVLDAIIAELLAEGQGRLLARRLSHPANTAGRNEAFVDTVDGQLRRLSDGKLSFTADSLARGKAATVEIDGIMSTASLIPQMAPPGRR